MKKIQMYTDGACKNNPGIGGWGVVILEDKKEICLCGSEPHTTNNRMELSAAIHGLAYLQEPTHIILYTDSVYVQQGITVWLQNWIQRGWKNSSNKPVKNQDLWQILDQSSQQHEIEWKWVKGHIGMVYNEKADQLANQAIEVARKNKYT